MAQPFCFGINCMGSVFCWGYFIHHCHSICVVSIEANSILVAMEIPDSLCRDCQFDCMGFSHPTGISISPYSPFRKVERKKPLYCWGIKSSYFDIDSFQQSDSQHAGNRFSGCSYHPLQPWWNTKNCKPVYSKILSLSATKYKIFIDEPSPNLYGLQWVSKSIYSRSTGQ